MLPQVRVKKAWEFPHPLWIPTLFQQTTATTGWDELDLTPILKTSRSHSRTFAVLDAMPEEFMFGPKAIFLLGILLCAEAVALGRNAEQTGTSMFTDAGEAAGGCADARSKLMDFVAWSRDRASFREIPVWNLLDSSAFFFVSGMTIDADGAPNAYSPDDTGLDELANAGNPSHWDGIVTDKDGTPLLQGEGDPFPGYYISCTALADRTKEYADPIRYVDASKIPYVVLPDDVADNAGARLGDFAVVMNLQNGKSSYAIFADIGTMGEGSIALAENLGIWSDARNGGQSDAILYLVFPESGNLQPRSIDEIESEAERLLNDCGGIERLASCAKSQR
jgi:hypothetical protein